MEHLEMQNSLLIIPTFQISEIETACMAFIRQGVTVTSENTLLY